MSSPHPPTKKRVGIPSKLYASDQARDMIAKYHGFHEMLDLSNKYDQLFENHCKSSMSAIVRPPTKTQRRFTEKKKEELPLNYSISGNYCETARVFDINESTVLGMIDARPLPNKMKLSSKCRVEDC